MAGDAVSKQIEPPPVRDLLRQAITLHRNGELAQAEPLYARVLAHDPSNPDATHLLGVLRFQQGRPAEALGLVAAALRMKPDSPGILSNHGLVLEALGRFDEAVAAYDRAIARQPADAEILANRGNALFRLGRYEEALASYRSGLAHDPENAEIHWSIGLIDLLRGALPEGWDGYEWRWRRREFPDRERTFDAPLWRGESSLAGKTILLHAEQGLGDTIQFVRYVPRVARLGARVVLEVQGALAPLLAQVPGVARLVPRGATLPPFDCHCPLLSLPLAFKTELRSIPADVPYLSAPPSRVAGWRSRLPAGAGPRAGLVWAGNPQHGNDRNRSLPLAALAPLLDVPGITFVSLQKDLGQGDRATLRVHPEIVECGSRLADFADTAAVISLLDLVVTVDTAVAHLAGAMGRPVWILLPDVPDWRWLLDRPDSPWYPTARLFRQPRRGDWESALSAAAAALTRWVAGRPRPDGGGDDAR